MKYFLLLLSLCCGTVFAQSADERLRAGYAAFEIGDGKLTLRLLEPLAEAGNKYAQYAVAETLLFSKDVPRDIPRATVLHLKAAAQEIPGSQTRIGTAYFYGDHVPQNYDIARQWFERGAINGHAAAQTNLAVMHADGIGGPRNPERAVYWLNQALPRGEANTLNTLANAYARAEGAPRDYTKALGLYRQAAALGSLTAMDNLGGLYRDGKGVAQDYTRALAWYQKAAAQSEPKALNNLGILYLKGLGVERDTKKAGDYFRRASQRSHADAEFNLGLMFLYGNGHEMDHYIGTRWMALAAAHGSETAQAYMVVLTDSPHAAQEDRKMLAGYSNGLGASGSVQAQRLIAELFDSGRFAARNLEQARRWFVLAARQGDTEAAARLQALKP